MSERPRAFDMLGTARRAGRMPVAWRCSPDMGTRLREPIAVEDVSAAPVTFHELQSEWGGYPARTRFVAPPELFLGLPVHVDEALPAKSLVLESVFR